MGAQDLKDTLTRFADCRHAAGPAVDHPDVASCIVIVGQSLSLRSHGYRSSGNAVSVQHIDKLVTGNIQRVPTISPTVWASRMLWIAVRATVRRMRRSLPPVDWSPSNWDVQLSDSFLASSNHSQVMYVNPTNLSKLAEPGKGHRPISGRMLVLLTQSSSALGAVGAQVLDSS